MLWETLGELRQPETVEDQWAILLQDNWHQLIDGDRWQLECFLAGIVIGSPFAVLQIEESEFWCECAELGTEAWVADDNLPWQIVFLEKPSDLLKTRRRAMDVVPKPVESSPVGGKKQQ